MTAKKDEPQATTPTREYAIYGRRAFADGDGVEVFAWVKVATWTARNHPDALRGWGNDHPDEAQKYLAFRVVTASAEQELAGSQETRFVVRKG